MNKSIILNILSLLVLIIGIAIIIIATIKPMILIKLNKESYLIKDNQKYIKYLQKLYIVFGIACIIISLLSLFKIIDTSILGIGLAVISLISSISIKRYA